MIRSEVPGGEDRCPDQMSEGRVYLPKSDVWGGGTLSCDLSHDTCDVPTPPLDRMTDTCENITFPKLIPLFRTSGDVSSGFQSQSGFCLIRTLQRHM